MYQRLYRNREMSSLGRVRCSVVYTNFNGMSFIYPLKLDLTSLDVQIVLRCCWSRNNFHFQLLSFQKPIFFLYTMLVSSSNSGYFLTALLNSFVIETEERIFQRKITRMKIGDFYHLFDRKLQNS